MKKISCIIMVLFLIISSVLYTSAVVENDINSDGKFDIKDLNSIQKYIVKSINFNNNQIKISDLNKDSKVNIADVTLGQKMLAGLAVNVINIKVNNKTFKAKVFNTDTGRAFLKLLPLTIRMSELNSNEKYYYMDKSLPVNSESVCNIRSGEIMLYGSDCLVLFYDSFKTPYSYTKIGYIENTDGLKNALGNGNPTVVFSK